MMKFDEFLTRLVQLMEKDKDYRLVILGSMGQTASSAQRADTLCAVKDTERFMKQMQLAEGDWEVLPAMAPQFNVKVKDTVKDTFRQHLNSLSIDGEPLIYRENRDGFFSLDFLFLGIHNEQAQLMGRTLPLQELGLQAEKIQDGVATTGWHTPQGAMLIYDPNCVQGRKDQDISTLTICPSILENFGVRVPDYMSHSRVEELIA